MNRCTRLNEILHVDYIVGLSRPLQESSHFKKKIIGYKVKATGPVFAIINHCEIRLIELIADARQGLA